MSAKTPEQIAEDVLTRNTRHYGDDRMVTKMVLEAAREAQTEISTHCAAESRVAKAGEPAAAHASDWELSSFEDETGKWLALQTYDPQREAAGEGDERICAASLLMSDVEALDLYRALGSEIASRTPALLPEYDTESSVSRQHFIDTGAYLLRVDTEPQPGPPDTGGIKRVQPEGGWNNALAREIAEALEDRETDTGARAAQWVSENEDDALWDLYIGPMLNDIESIQGVDE